MVAGRQECPKCPLDWDKDNLILYDDGSAHCFSCGHHIGPKYFTGEKRERNNSKATANLPNDSTTEIPPRALVWLLQYGLSLHFWRPLIQWSAKAERLIITPQVGCTFAQGRYFGEKAGAPKWKSYGDTHKVAVHLKQEGANTDRIVLVEDVISAHKVSHVCQALPLFGVAVFPGALTLLKYLGVPAVMWLDRDQDALAPKQAARLNMFTGLDVSYISSSIDPKLLSFDEIKEKLR